MVANGGPAAWSLVSGDSAKTVSLRATDNAGNLSVVSTANITLDTVAPTISAISINASAIYATVAAANIVSTVAGSPTEIAFSSDGVNFGAYAAIVGTGNAYTLPAPDGANNANASSSS